MINNIWSGNKVSLRAINELIYEPGVTYVFDCGYIDYSVFDRYCLDIFSS
jgi:hypothetical protein